MWNAVRARSLMYFYVSSGRVLDLIYIPGRRIVRQVVHTHVLHVPLSLNSII